VVSTWGNDQEYWRESATAFAAIYFLMQGTPFIYQGQEIGMTNVQFDSIDDYNDVSAKNMYTLKKAEGVSHEEIMEVIWASGRDNSRTPMQWSNELNAGFSTGSPWIKVNPNYKSINVESQKKDETSILNFYKKMIQLKKANEVFTYGTYDLLLAKDPQVYAYTRTLNQEKVLVIANLSVKPATVKDVNVEIHNLILSNYDTHEQEATLVLLPYEARVYRL
jgi:alpha-glucosidase